MLCDRLRNRLQSTYLSMSIEKLYEKITSCERTSTQLIITVLFVEDPNALYIRISKISKDIEERNIWKNVTVKMLPPITCYLQTMKIWTAITWRILPLALLHFYSSSETNNQNDSLLNIISSVSVVDVVILSSKLIIQYTWPKSHQT